MAAIPTLGSFDPKTTTADDLALAEEAGYLRAHSSRIIGRGSDVVDQMSATATQFSEMVAAPITREGGEFESAATTAMEGAVWGATVTDRWAVAVLAYKRRIEALHAQWADAVASSFGVTIGDVADQITGGMPGDVQGKILDNKIAEVGQDKLAAMNGQADAAYEEFKAKAAETGRWLREGPTPANLQALGMDGGATDWLLCSVFGAEAPLPLVGADGKRLAAALRDALSNHEPLTAAQRAQFAAMLALAERAEYLQQHGGKLTTGELAFLEQFYGGMDKPWDATNPIKTEVLYLLPEILEGSQIPAGDQATILAGIGGGLLALSDPRLGGGTGRLPASMRNLVDHYFGKGAKPEFSATTGDQIRALGRFFEAADAKGLTEIQGGRDLSAALTLAVADANPTLFRTSAEDELIAIMKVSTRNVEANAALLNGDLQHPDFGENTPEHVLRGLFGPQWKDDGKAAAGLIGWIPELSASDDPRLRDLATETAFNLITTMSNDQKTGPWNESAYQFFTDGYGRIGNFHDAPIGAANPAIAQAMSGTAIAYIDYLDAPDIGRDSELTLNGDPRADDMYLDLATRARFVELVMGDPTAGNDLGAAAYAKVIAEAGDMNNWGGWNDAREKGMDDGELIRLLDKAYANVYEDATGDATTEAEQDKAHATWVRSSSTILKEAVLEIPGVKAIKGIGQVLIREGLELGKWGPGHVEGTKMWPFADNSAPGADERKGDPKYEQFSFEVTHSVIQQMLHDPNSGIDLDDIAKADSRLLVENPATGTYTLRSAEDLLDANMEPTEPGHEGNLNFRTANTALQGLFGKDLAEAYRNYIDVFTDQRGK
jgi:hypothetical protein